MPATPATATAAMPATAPAVATASAAMGRATAWMRAGSIDLLMARAAWRLTCWP
jgi:hypothetical protein